MKLLEDLSREKVEKERALYEQELKKLEREKQYIVWNHELLNITAMMIKVSVLCGAKCGTAREVENALKIV